MLYDSVLKLFAMSNKLLILTKLLSISDNFVSFSYISNLSIISIMILVSGFVVFISLHIWIILSL